MILEIAWKSENNSFSQPSNRNEVHGDGISANIISESPVTNSRGDVTHGDKLVDSIKDSFNSQHVPPEFYKPSKENLKHLIGVEVQKFAEKFSRIHFAPEKERAERYREAKENLGKIMDLHNHANLVLSNTEIPTLMKELSNFFVQYSSQISMLSASNEDRMGYIKGNSQVPQIILNEITKWEKKLDKTISQINSYVKQLVELCKA